MKKAFVTAVAGMFVLAGCADHPYLSAGAAALAAGAAATMVSNHNQQEKDKRQEEDRDYYYQHGKHRGEGKHHRAVLCSDLPYDAPNWQRENCEE